MDIVVTLPKKEGGFEHLHDKIHTIEHEGELAYWYMGRFPINFDEEIDKIFVCADGTIHGFFTIYNVVYEEDNEYGKPYRVCLNDWTTIKPIRKKGFRGFQYRKFKWEQDGGLCNGCGRPTNYRECAADAGVWICKRCFEDGG